MIVEVIQNGTILRSITHNGQTYFEAPASGEYEIRLTNNHSARRLAVVSVDGLNVIDGSNASYTGQGYVLGPWQSTTIMGWLRGAGTCARFTFAESTGSYAAQTGRGTKNTGVIGVAVFDEKVKAPVFIPPLIIQQPVYAPTHRYDFWYSTAPNSADSVPLSHTYTVNSALGGDFTASAAPAPAEDDGITLCAEGPTAPQRRRVSAQSSVRDLGTKYGREEAFYTQTVDFDRASQHPVMVLSFRYGTTAKLEEWGVPISKPVPTTPSAFPAQQGYAPPPIGWRG